MDFYVLKKNNELTAIPADEVVCKNYLESGYSYVDKIAACTEAAAISKLKNQKFKVIRWPLFATGFVVLTTIFLLLQR
ncbi:hypothetical protein [Pseudoalteromonas tunicata]|jgi:hypothetical protein|uniref:Uncharacterized protein n=1 Tax=Pseudoalteromonas tunicata D2 TaxID=87626 RepID=A4C3S6_9GAMM|nr:hypothetical protein [Pseudoalteromonas tunicata]ATC96514.1 hypothetical protein PTUN_b0041 [Pseudoalteromonas tunicata]AXT33384.1 hypothetical protein D1819_21560 [Pseudoalteromonas tunicata]EAR30208.1 hypothetical protein PTD2_01526 [Pseudoalteromonas tunicata D2]MDP4985490.1 hypothetical protein [Pseudoalteromonas tunicata]MDP5214483.1 hypothetical protein [Pseudoalteromonas tunicata]